MIDGYSNPTEDNQQSESGMIKSSIKKIQRQQLNLGCLFQETHAFLLFAVCFFVRFFLDIEK